MDAYDLTVNQFKRAAAIKERIEALNKELRNVLDTPAKAGAASAKKRTMSAVVTKKIAATQRARWANLRRAKSAARTASPAPKAKKKTVSRATRAKLRIIGRSLNIRKLTV